MKIPLSKRLLSCCEQIRPGACVADVGCDHGYLGIYLLTQGIARQVYGADIRPGPLESAVRNSVKFGVRDKMQFFLSDGVQNIPRDFDTLVCAGMGADTMISILRAAPWLQSGAYRLVLQCQSKTPMLRKYLSDTGWAIRRETVLQDGRFLYTVMDVSRDAAAPLTPGQCYLPPALFQSPSSELPAYCKRVMDGLETVVYRQKDRADPLAVAALAELQAQPPKWKEDV